MNGKEIVSLITLFLTVLCITLCSGCRTARGDTGAGSFARGTDYVRPESTDAANHAIRERIYYLEREIADGRELNNRLIGQLEGARAAVREINESSQTIGELSRRSASSLQEIIGNMERLILWIDWVTNRVQHLESLLAAQVQN
jgi:hypothetical protein